MKKFFIVILILIIVLVLVIPIPISPAKDGGSRQYAALTYKVVKWHHLYGEDQLYSETKVYFFPYNFLSLDDLFERELSQIDI